jgi:hypothetical protein
LKNPKERELKACPERRPSEMPSNNRAQGTTNTHPAKWKEKSAQRAGAEQKSQKRRFAFLFLGGNV